MLLRDCRLSLPLALLSVVFFSSVGSAQENASSLRVNFARQVLPILSSKCFACHGPDTHDADMLRLDSFDAASEDRGGYRGVDAQAPEKSAVLLRIHDSSDPMPPADAEQKLTDAEREILSAWIRQGGDYEQHWSFVPPVKTTPPQGDVVWAREAIDAFIKVQLDARGIAFAPQADRSTLARRVALVLTGLPPEPEQLRRFLADESPEAYERLVDELLASPRFGEHQARYWLDAVRYGDTHGLHLDNRRGIYPYRDWVVRSFNENLPLDQFIQWQVAGDLLPNPSLEQMVATGFVRMNPTTAEGGAIPDEFQAKNNFDRTEAFGTVLLGMTLTCARCHTHKYDPITQTEYYQLLAFFNSTAEPPLDSNAYAFGPTVQTPPDQPSWYRWKELEANTQKLFSEINIEPAKLAEMIEQSAAANPWTSQQWKISSAVANDAAKPADGDWQATDKLPGKADQRLPADNQAIWVSFEVNSAKAQTLWLGLRAGSLTRVWINDTLQETGLAGEPGQWNLQRLSVPQGGSQIVIQLQGDASSSQLEFSLENPWSKLAEVRDWNRLSEVERLLLIADEQGPIATETQRDAAQNYARQMQFERSQFTTTLVAQELAQPRPTRLLRRGEYDLPAGEPVSPGVPAAIGGWPQDAPRNRVGLAQWLTSRDNPLVARVLVNGIWQRTFGAGLVRTPEDFGLQGSQPTHPELLDWLAVDLQESGWNLKFMLKQMVMSKTFTQQSGRRAELDDPENLLFARGPRLRMDAEMLRDIGLWASSILDPHMGGEGVKPYQPDGMWSAMAHPASNTKEYVQDHGQRLYRRSLYVYWKRTTPHPMMTIFDAPDRESSCVRRTRSNTALQSLAMFNETQRVEIARSLAQRLIQESADDQQRIDRLYELLACRAPSQREREICLGLVEQMRARYASDPQAALAYVTVGEHPRDESIATQELAAWSQLTTVVLTSDIGLMLY